MKIAFVHNNKAFLPGLYGYCQFFSRYNIQCELVTVHDLRSTNSNLEWFFLGSDFSSTREGIYKIHEYPSASLPPFRKWKDRVKRSFNSQPDFRLFQNEFVKQCLNFHDNIPFGYREPGIPEEWLTGIPTLNKEYDFIYMGDVSVSRKIKKLLNRFTGELKEQSFLVLSHRYEDLKEQFKDHGNIIFKGPVQKEQLREYLLRSRFALNYIPDVAPFNRQTSTKLLEYITCRVPVISTQYEWMKEFEQENGGKYFYLNSDLSNLTWEAVNNYSYSFPDLSGWTSEHQIRKSGVLEFLMSRFPELKF